MEHLVELKSGCLRSFQAVYDLHHKKLYSYILKKTSSEYMAEEVVQLTFIRIWEKRQNLSSDFPLSAQIFRTAGSILIDQLRKEAVNKRSLSIITDSETHFYEDTVKDTMDALDLIIEGMAPMRKKIFKLSRKEGLSYKEIAEMLAISPKTVENHIAKAIKQIRMAFSSIISLAILLKFFY